MEEQMFSKEIRHRLLSLERRMGGEAEEDGNAAKDIEI